VNIETSRQAAEALRPFAGNFAATLFTLVLSAWDSSPSHVGRIGRIRFCRNIRVAPGLNKKLKQARLVLRSHFWSQRRGCRVDFIGINPVKALY